MSKTPQRLAPGLPSSNSAEWLDIDVVEDSGDWSSFADAEALIAAAARAVCAHERFRGASAASVCIALSDDESLRTLNRTYRGKDTATNVLSFPAPAGERETSGDGRRSLGDVVLALETLRREAAEQGIDPRHHLQHLVVHGLLHLLEFDHESDAEAAEMEALETAILATLGIPDPYADAADAPRPATRRAS